jgi:aminopeptidase N
MKTKILSISFFSLFLCKILGNAQGYDERLKVLDILRYEFKIEIQDSSDRIQGMAKVSMRLLQTVPSVHLDLVAMKEGPKGMKVLSVEKDGIAMDYHHEGEDLEVRFPDSLAVASEFSIQIHYEGIPADGLVISYSEETGRSFFGDNWPNRAHHWLPVVDHPADKASVVFTITAPSHYLVVSNGRLAAQSALPDGRQVSRWENSEPLPTKVMVFGAADFAMENVGNVGSIPVSTWVFRSDEKSGFHDYAQGKPILEWFIMHLGAYPWVKLANVQSRTRYGGMENASCIFYAESSVTGDASCEALMAHEIAHQWFGNSASEANWYHVWLSEGFATYWTHIYFENLYGREVFEKRMREDRATVTGWAPTMTYAVVDPTIPDLNLLLNPNSYQKGGWVLHMLRNRLGDDLFFQGIKEYYSRFRYGNALTSDLQRALEDVSGHDLELFFEQWIYRPGHPKLDVSWAWNSRNKCAQLEIKQLQNSGDFVFQLELAFKNSEGQPISESKVEVKSKYQKISVMLDQPPAEVELDPHTRLLFEGKVRRK